jgi:hypothetical protein
MKLTAEDYRQSYRVLSDEEFLAIDRDDLVEVARHCYDAELKRRQLEPPFTDDDEAAEEDTPPAVAAPELPKGESLVQVALISQERTAREVLKMLQEASLPATITDHPKATGSYAEACFGLMTAASCASEVRDLIAGHLTWNNQELVRRWFERDWVPDDIDLDDFSVTVDEHFGEENKVAARITASGVDPETKKGVTFSGIAIVHLNDGEIGRHWIRLDV